MAVILKRFGKTQFSASLSFSAQLRRKARHFLKRKGGRVEFSFQIIWDLIFAGTSVFLTWYNVKTVCRLSEFFEYSLIRLVNV